MKFVSKTAGLVKWKRKCPFKCNKCNNRYSSQGQLNECYRMNHDRVQCPHCPMTFSTLCSLTHHLYSHEIATKKCRCGKTFCFDSELKSHKLKHHRIRTQHCTHPSCGRSYFSASDLAQHARMHDDTIWKCQQCEYKTGDKRLLKSHQRKHICTLWYTCRKCDKGFIYYTQWAHHTKSESCG